MQSTAHKQHIAARVSHNNCSECRADTERGFVSSGTWGYQHVHDYLTWARPRLQAIRSGADSVDARIWHRRFLLALNRRISLKVARVATGRKFSDSYLDRLTAMKHAKGAYLVRFAARGASCLDS